MTLTSKAFYKKMKKRVEYVEKIHCPLIIDIMMKTGRYVDFCAEVAICERTFFYWVRRNELFGDCYDFGKVLARRNWELEGDQIKEELNEPGVISNRFEHWKLIGWSRFGVSKNSRIKLNLDPKSNPSEHYSQLLEQASHGDFTASEIKQLMEAINVGLSTHHAIELQKQINEIKADAEIMKANSSGNNPFADKRA